MEKGMIIFLVLWVIFVIFVLRFNYMAHRKPSPVNPRRPVDGPGSRILFDEPKEDRFVTTKNHHKKIYIAGKSSGSLTEECLPCFNRAERDLIQIGVPAKNIVTPLNIGIAPGTQWPETMDACLKALGSCSAIYLLRSWEDSAGSYAELTEAAKLHKEIFFEETNDLDLVAKWIITDQD